MIRTAACPHGFRTAREHREGVRELLRLWGEHDRTERKILLLERKFTDAELKRIGAAGG